MSVCSASVTLILSRCLPGDLLVFPGFSFRLAAAFFVSLCLIAVFLACKKTWNTLFQVLTLLIGLIAIEINRDQSLYQSRNFSGAMEPSWADT